LARPGGGFGSKKATGTVDNNAKQSSEICWNERIIHLHYPFMFFVNGAIQPTIGTAAK